MTTFTPADVSKELLRRRAAKDSFYEFFRQAWASMVPGYQYVDGWHVQALCFPGHTKILTENGPRAISEIVLSQWSGRVLSANHKIGALEWRPVTAHMKSPGKTLVRVTMQDGSHISCTEDHPIFVKGKGYVSAAGIFPGDIVLHVRELRHAVSAASRHERQVVHETLLSGTGSEAREQGHLQTLRKAIQQVARKRTWGVLLQKMRRKGKIDPGKLQMSVVWRLQGVGCRQKLPGMLRKVSDEGVRGGVRKLREGCVPFFGREKQDITPSWRFLQLHMLRTICSWATQPFLYRWAPTGNLREPMEGSASQGFGARWPCVFPMRGKAADAGHSPHQSRREKQRDVESRGPMSSVSQQPEGLAAEGYGVSDSVVSHVEREVRIPDFVFNIEVEGNNNYVADNVLVHNCEHMEEVYRGNIRNLLINCPPRTLKTLVVDIAFPAWVWINRPTEKFIYSSYSYAIAEDASIACRSLLRTAWFKARWGDIVALSPERDTKDYFANTAGGERIISSVDGTLTGRGGDILVGNDLNRVGDEHKSSDADLAAASHFWNTVIPTRLNDPKTGRKVVVQQRTHEKDISGEIIDADPDGKDWVKLILPLEFESERRCVTVPLPSTNGKPWRDPRKKEGESLIPARMGPEEIASLKKALGSQYAISGQLQQQPSPSEGGIIKKKWFQAWKQSEPPKCDFVILSVDTAMSKKDGTAFSAATAWGVFEDENEISNIILLMRWRERAEYPELRERMKRLAHNYLDIRDLKLIGPTPAHKPPDLIIIEAKANGLSLIQDLRRAKVIAHPFNPDKMGDKTNRVRLVTPILESGRVWLPYAGPKFDRPRPFADEFLEAAAKFPNAKSRDLVDTMTQALWRLQQSGWVWNKGDDAPVKESYKPQRTEAFY